jgi:excisionase family DNA binding protein
MKYTNDNFKEYFKMSNNEYLTAKDISNILEITVRAVQRWLEDGRLKSFKVGGNYRVKPEDLLKYLENLGNPESAMEEFKRGIENCLNEKEATNNYLNEAKGQEEKSRKFAKIKNWQTGTGPKPF